MAVPITLYTAKVCPYAQRVELAFAEAGIDVTKYFIDLQNKPEWFAPKINPASKVPAVAYGGPPTSPENPSPESVKLAESLILVEFVADLAPKSGLLPSDPVQRAQARFFVDTVSNKYVPGFAAFVMRGDSPEGLLAGFQAVQDLLPKEGLALGGNQFTIADAAFLPFLGRTELLLRTGVGKYQAAEGKKVYSQLFEDAKFARLQKYFKDATQRESWKTFYTNDISETMLARIGRAKSDL
ncbi:uncharacterized protein STEHIDRAFT_85218 [Stereum hirsutum FP-91666 SS1]|uniref:uncharacterized protein n=1 Tax=Stereum hirsutum (strain FP-91666) TaxID=721885 RepID=UPI00044497EC|nr:uncharacterized protein STEHIDRAFT_85218 [Stereum hirsutum FP-91666 SS1]EIM81899.1 hypothetical protein STEHIDRAFT_85218 [Stereum hirsutum FP-91666 SS1]